MGSVSCCIPSAKGLGIMPDTEMNVRNIVNGHMSDSLTPPVAQCPAQGTGSSNVGREEGGKRVGGKE